LKAKKYQKRKNFLTTAEDGTPEVNGGKKKKKRENFLTNDAAVSKKYRRGWHAAVPKKLVSTVEA